MTGAEPRCAPSPGMALEERMGLADRLRQETLNWHRRAERSGFVKELLQGGVSRQSYALFLRNLLPAYAQMEAALQQHRRTPGLCHIARPEVHRAAAIEADLRSLSGTDWRETLPLLATAKDYAERVGVAAEGDGTRLLGHAYVRYLGDLNGGRIIRSCLIRSLKLSPESLAFYSFADIDDVEGFKTDYRAGFDRAGSEIGDIASVVDEAVIAFRLNIELSEAVAASG